MIGLSSCYRRSPDQKVILMGQSWGGLLTAYGMIIPVQ
jgi:hypothetical protein